MDQFIDFTFHFWRDFSTWHPPFIVLYTILGFGGLSAWTMTKFAAMPPLFAGPISFIALTFAAMVANFAARSQPLMGSTDLQKALLFTVAGHAVAGLILLALFKAGRPSVAR
jgi:hypothetical protein